MQGQPRVWGLRAEPQRRIVYCELHCHTHYSLLDGASSPEALLDRAVALGMPALAITDHNGLYGVVPFYRAARSRGLRAVIGAELSLAHGSHLTLLAEDQAGYANLCRLISHGHLAGTKGCPRFTIEDVARHSGGLLCLSGCRQSAFARAILDGDEDGARRAAGLLLEIFGREHFWIELQRHWLPGEVALDAGLRAVADWAGVGTVATNNVHYATPDGHRLHDVLTATRHNTPVAALGSRRRPNSEFFLKGEAEMGALFADCPDALVTACAIAERCEVSLDFSTRRFPQFPPASESFPQGVAPGETAFSTLHGLCQKGLQERYHPVTRQAVEQLAHELSVVESAHLSDYLLIVWDIVRFARERGIRCQGRGSAANSLVAYLLGITPVDPLRYNLLFERFLSDQADTMPDIDIDFAADRRDEVIAYVYERYGADHAAMVCNVVTYQARSALRDVARALGYMPEDVDGLSRWALDHTAAAASYGESMNDPSSVAALQGRSGTEAGQLLADLAAQLVGTPRHLSVHVGGMLITAQPLVEVVPLERAAKPGLVVAQWNKDALEDAGLIKVDLLALRTLGMLSEITALIASRHGVDLRLEDLALDDPEVYRLLARGDTIGCFQVESRAQAQMLPRLQPQSFEDLIIEVAIVRPGPIQGGMVHPYLRRRQGVEAVTYPHPLLEPVLRESLGIIIFQEQVIRVAVALAGFTPGEADRLRRAMSRSRSAEAMAELRARFVAGASARGVADEVAEEVFRQLQGFATYGFCKSHAAAFALVAYQTLWLKVHYPAEFYCALLNHQPMGFYSPDVVVNDARRHGIAILRPDVNLSEEGCTLEPNGKPPALQGRDGDSRPRVRLGLRYLYGLGESGRRRVLESRRVGASVDQPFAGLADFCRRTRLPKSVVRDMIRAGALDGLGEARRQMLWELGGLRYDEETLVDEPPVSAELPPLSEGEALTWDYELLGLSPDDHPLRLLRPQLRADDILSAAELATRPAGEIIRVAGMVVVRQAPPTAKGHLFVTLEDETGLANLVIRPDLYAAARSVLHKASLLVAEGAVQREGRAVSVLVRKVRALTPAP